MSTEVRVWDGSGWQLINGPVGSTGSVGATGAKGDLGNTGPIGPTGIVWTKYTKTYADLAAAGLTNNIELFSLASKGVIHAIIAQPTASFTGGLIIAYAITIGVAGNTNKYLASVNTFAAPGTISASNTVGCESTSGATSIRMYATSAVGPLNAATAGAIDIWVSTSTLS